MYEERDLIHSCILNNLLNVEKQLTVCGIRPVLLAYQSFYLVSGSSQLAHGNEYSIVLVVSQCFNIVDILCFDLCFFQCGKSAVGLTCQCGKSLDHIVLERCICTTVLSQ